MLPHSLIDSYVQIESWKTSKNHSPSPILNLAYSSFISFSVLSFVSTIKTITKIKAVRLKMTA